MVHNLLKLFTIAVVLLLPFQANARDCWWNGYTWECRPNKRHHHHNYRWEQRDEWRHHPHNYPNYWGPEYFRR